MPEKKNKARVAAALAVMFLLVPAVAVRGQNTSPGSGGDRLGGEALGKFFLDAGETLTAPLHWDGGDLLAVGVLAATTFALFAHDDAIARWIRKFEPPKTADQITAQLGNGYFLFAFDAALYLVGAAFDSASFRTTALVGMESFLTASAIALVLKGIVGRARPSARETAASFHPFSLQNRHASFPSGDAAGVFAVGTVIAERSDSIAVEILTYVLAGLCALNRVHDDQHWVSDIVVGSAIGFFVGKKISALNLGRGERPVRLALGPARTGLGLTVDFVF
ncbi:MAG: phosphatase PAP2 family protein [Candidatus Aminicenantales bacterium]